MKKTGLYIGRFQPLTLGHIRVIDAMLEECDSVLIVIGSTQEVGTEKNPFKFSERKQMIKSVYKDSSSSEKWDKIRIIGLPDIFNPKGWVQYVLDSIQLKLEEGEINSIPNVYYCGSYYDGYFFENSGLDIRIVDRTDPNYPSISSTLIRQMCQYQDKRWQNYVPKQIWNTIQELQDKYNWKEINL